MEQIASQMSELIDSVKKVIVDSSVLDAVHEAAFTVAAFFAVWLVGRALGLGRKQNKREKKVNRFAPANSFDFPDCDQAEDPRKAGRRTSARGVPNNGTKFEPSTGLKKESDLLAKAVRIGNGSRLPVLIDAAKHRLLASGACSEHDHVDAELLCAALRACAARRVFGEALEVYDHVSARLTGATGTIWSLLFWSAVETSEFHRCDAFLVHLRAAGNPSNYDFVNMTRYCVHNNDIELFGELVKEFQEQGCEVDLISRNRALAVCVSSNAFDLAGLLISGTPQLEVDVIALNTMMKGFATMGKHDHCFELYTQMRGRGLLPSEMTYGVLIDALIDAGKMELVRKVFDDLKTSGQPLNVVLWTTFIKGLVKTGNLTEAVKALDDMIASQSVVPDLVTFSTIMKEQSAVGDVVGLMQLLEKMVQQGLTPDDVIFHTVLTGCSTVSMDSTLILQVLDCLIERGLKPSTTTLSVLMKALSKAEAWTEALALLEASPQRFRLFPEARIYAQLGQACAHARQPAETLSVYVAMLQSCALRGAKVDKAASNRLVRLCFTIGRGDQAQALHDMAVKGEGPLTSEAIDAVLQDMVSAADRSWRRSARNL